MGTLETCDKFPDDRCSYMCFVRIMSSDERSPGVGSDVLSASFCGRHVVR